jgi:cytochrome c-type biogenesis protein
VLAAGTVLALPAAVTADPLGFLVAFGAGILSFVSPCVLPLVPGYISMVSGLSAAELEASRRLPVPRTVPAPSPVALSVAAGVAGSRAGGAPTATALDAPEPAATPDSGAETAAARFRPALLKGIGLFIAGFTVVFVALGATASGLGHLLDAHKEVLGQVAGVLIIVLGLVLLVGALPEGFWRRVGSGPAAHLATVVGERRFDVRPSAMGAWAAPVMGVAFAFAWTPCIGPVLGAIFYLATTRSTVAGGAGLLFAYSLGLGVPFLVTGLAFGRLTAVYARARRGLWVVSVVGGVILVAFGALLVAGQLGWLTTELETFLRAIGLGRLATS